MPHESGWLVGMEATLLGAANVPWSLVLSSCGRSTIAAEKCPSLVRNNSGISGSDALGFRLIRRRQFPHRNSNEAELLYLLVC